MNQIQSRYPSNEDCNQAVKVRQLTAEIERQSEVVSRLHVAICELEDQLATLYDPQIKSDQSGKQVQAPTPNQIAWRLCEHNNSIDHAIKRLADLRNRLHI